MTRLPKKWEKELAVQRALREKLARAERDHRTLLNARLLVLRTGGNGWARRLSQVNVQIARAWEKVRVQFLKLYERQVPA